MVWLTRIRSRSMEPTLHDGELVLTRTLRGPVRRGDVVVADSVELRRRIVKRVVGLPGERVVIEDGAVVVDGARLAEPYASASLYRGAFAVPDVHYLLLGDNRDASDDARSWRVPCTGRAELVGRLVGRSWPPHQPGAGYRCCSA